MPAPAEVPTTRSARARVPTARRGDTGEHAGVERLTGQTTGTEDQADRGHRVILVARHRRRAAPDGRSTRRRDADRSSRTGPRPPR